MNQWLQIRRLRGPAFLLLIGILLLLSEWDVIRWEHSWPLLLILAGVLSLAERTALSRMNQDQIYPQGTSGYPGYPGYQAPSYPGSPAYPPSSPTSTALIPQDPTTGSAPDQGRS